MMRAALLCCAMPCCACCATYRVQDADLAAQCDHVWLGAGVAAQPVADQLVEARVNRPGSSRTEQEQQQQQQQACVCGSRTAFRLYICSWWFWLLCRMHIPFPHVAQRQQAGSPLCSKSHMHQLRAAARMATG